ncbi:MAG TPA: aldo/keto reductase [Gemmatimonadales bacterium]
MRTLPLGPDAQAVTCFGLGGMPLSTANRPDEAQAMRVLHAVLDRGVTLIDTANVYCRDHTDIGHNERLIAKALATWGGTRDGIVVATKAGMTRSDQRWGRDGRPSFITQSCDQSLVALGVDRIDLYQFHAPDAEIPLEESVGAFADLRDAGKIRWFGLSNVSVDEIERARTILPVTTVQNRLNPFFREAIDDGVVQHCATEGLGFLAYSPVGGGRLNKKLPDHAAVQPVAARHGASPHAVVLAWVAAQGTSVIPIPGSRTVAHALDAMGAADLVLSPDDLAAIDAAEFSRA